MSNRTQHIEALRKVFHDSKMAKRYKNGALDDLDLHGALQDAFADVTRQKFHELKDAVRLYLNDVCPEYRAEAVKILGWDTRLFDQDFCKEEAYHIWLDDQDEDVKCSALNAWSDYYRDTKNSFVLQTLYDVIISDQYSPRIRAWALYRFINVAEASDYPRGLCDINVFDNCYLEDREYVGNDKFLADQVDWHKVHGIMDKYVPDWRAKIET